jgi:hypothetical protein
MEVKKLLTFLLMYLIFVFSIYILKKAAHISATICAEFLGGNYPRFPSPIKMGS